MQRKGFIWILLIFASSCIHAQQLLSVDTLLNNVISVAEKYDELIQTYEAEVYMRTYVETIKKNFLYQYTRFIPHFVLHDPKSDEAVIETISRIKYTYPYHYAHYLEYVTGTITNKKNIEMIPFDLLNINVYDETTPDESFIMPFRHTSSTYYTYRLKQTYRDTNKTYYEIEFNPLYVTPNLFNGMAIIEDKTWRIIRFEAEWVDFMNDFRLEITMGNEWETAYLPINFTIYKTTSYLGNVVANRYLARINYTDIVVKNQSFLEKNLNLGSFYETVENPVPVHNDSLFWERVRPIPLQAKESETIANAKKQQNIRSTQQNVDSITDSQRAQQFAQLMVADSRHQYKSTQIHYSGPLNPSMLGYTSQDGITYRQQLSLKINLKDKEDLHLNAFAGYMFKRKELFTDFSVKWNYDPAHRGNVSLSVGNGNRTYSSLFIQQVQDSLLNKGLTFSDISVDYYKDYYLRLFNDIEPINGFMVGSGIEYHIRRGTKNTAVMRAANAESDGIDEMFGTRYAFVPFLRLSWTPQQYYRFEGRRKIPVRSDYPTFQLELARSFKNIMGSTSEYNRIEVDISQRIPFGLTKSLQYHIGGGLFTDQKTEYFADFVYFAKNNFPQNWDDGIGGTFNLLNRNLYNASDSYFQAHIMYETPFLLLKSISPLSRAVLTERLYFSQLYTPYLISYTELGYGIGNRFFNTAVFGSFHKIDFNEIGIRISFTF